MKTKEETATIIAELAALLPPGEITTEAAAIQEHSGDRWFASHPPEVVALPRSTESVSRLLRFANQHDLPVTARGAGVGYVGGCVPVRGGVALSLKQMDRIQEINDRDFVAVAQAGVTTQALQEAAEKKGLYYPPDPASRKESSIGGNIATNAGGPRCLKYGVTRDYVLGLEAVLANGDVVRVGGRTHKNKTGFDFSRLFTGSEGCLAVVTTATLKLIPLPPSRACLAVGFDSSPAPSNWRTPSPSPRRPNSLGPITCSAARPISSSSWMARSRRSNRKSPRWSASSGNRASAP